MWSVHLCLKSQKSLLDRGRKRQRLCVIFAFLCVSAVQLRFGIFHRRGAEERRDYAEKLAVLTPSKRHPAF